MQQLLCDTIEIIKAVKRCLSLNAEATDQVPGLTEYLTT
jgi:hypothetical protein